MIVVGVDPGARHTGIAVLDTTLANGPGGYPPAGGVPHLLASTTVTRTDDGPLTEPPAAYLLDVLAAIVEVVRDETRPFDGLGSVDLIAVEGVTAPHWHNRGKASPIRPDAIIGTAIVYGAVLGRAWGIPLVTVPPGRNGHALPLTAYPAPLATTGRGQDKRRHERSAYDVAHRAATTPQALIRNGRTP